MFCCSGVEDILENELESDFYDDIDHEITGVCVHVFVCVLV